MRLCIFKWYYLSCTVILGSFSGIFRHSSIIQEHSRTYSELFVSLAYSGRWHIPFTKYIQTPRYIHITILRIVTKVPSWAFDTVLNVSRLSLLQLLSNFQSNFTVSLTLYFRHILAYLRLIQPYLFLSAISRTLAYLGTFCFSHTQAYSKR